MNLNDFKAPSMKAVSKIPYTPKNNGCEDCLPNWGIMGKCERHSEVISVNHMSLGRYLFWSTIGKIRVVAQMAEKLNKLR